jgi:hypothetical protein
MVRLPSAYPLAQIYLFAASRRCLSAATIAVFSLHFTA